MDPTTIAASIAVALTFLFLGYRAGAAQASQRKEKEWHRLEKEARRDAVKRSRSVLSGNFSEQIAPYFPDFQHSPTELRFIGKPIDFIAFTGMDEKDITEVVFIEVKSGQSKLSTQERRLRDAVRAGKVRWEEYRVP
jgi:predicted Holliday junction resolvase-like endonuclease